MTFYEQMVPHFLLCWKKMIISLVLTMLPMTAATFPIMTADANEPPSARGRLIKKTEMISPIPKAVPRFVRAGS